jgi:hypothetical protein
MTVNHWSSCQDLEQLLLLVWLVLLLVLVWVLLLVLLVVVVVLQLQVLLVWVVGWALSAAWQAVRRL